MACGMCEAHVNDVIRRVCPDAKKVKSSFKSGESSFVSEARPDEEKLKQEIGSTGYTVLSAATEEYVKKGWFR